MKKVLILALLLTASSASAQLGGLSVSCGKEIYGKCGITGGMAGIAQCIRQNFPTLTKPCQAELFALGQKQGKVPRKP